MSVTETEIELRWKTRMIPNGWDKPDGSGVLCYLRKYGNNISDSKLEAFAHYAKKRGCDAIAQEFINNTTYGWFKRSGDPFISYMNENFYKMAYVDNKQEKVEYFDLFTKADLNICMCNEDCKSFDAFRNILYKATKTLNNEYCIVAYETMEYGLSCFLCYSGEYDKELERKFSSQDYSLVRGGISTSLINLWKTSSSLANLMEHVFPNV